MQDAGGLVRAPVRIDIGPVPEKKATYFSYPHASRNEPGPRADTRRQALSLMRLLPRCFSAQAELRTKWWDQSSVSWWPDPRPCVLPHSPGLESMLGAALEWPYPATSEWSSSFAWCRLPWLWWSRRSFWLSAGRTGYSYCG